MVQIPKVDGVTTEVWKNPEFFRRRVKEIEQE